MSPPPARPTILFSKEVRLNFKLKPKKDLTRASELPTMLCSIGDMTWNGTGSWRNMRPVIDQQGCIRCGICWKFCPDMAVYIENSTFMINYDFCKGCGICATECPKQCIAMEEEGK